MEDPPPTGQRSFEIAALSDTGLVRTDNQDFTSEFEDPDGTRLLIVADGMGAQRGGATASRLCVQTVGEIFSEGVGPLVDRLRYAVELANERVVEAAGRVDLAGMATTVVALALPTHGSGVLAWVGDSRAYRLRQGRLQPLTHDHSLVAEWVRTGTVTAEEAKTHPRRNELLRSVGAAETVDVDIATVEVGPGDRFLLCTDGVSGHATAADIANALGAQNARAAAVRLIGLASAAGGADNATVQIAALPPKAASKKRPALDWRRAALAAATVLIGVATGFAFLRDEDEEVPPQVASAPEPPAPVAELPDRAEFERPPFDPDNPFGSSEAEQDPAPAEEEPELPAARPPPFIADRVPAPPLGPPRSTTLEEVEELAPVAAPPPTPPPPEPPALIDLRTEIERFLDVWKQAVLDNDYARYNALGFPSTRGQFDRDYAGSDADLALVHLGHVQTDPGRIRLRVRATYQYTDAAGAHHTERLHRLLLRQTETGLVYAGTWD